jgi:CubicO group peptidase (beta-lactamase class C family)
MRRLVVFIFIAFLFITSCSKKSDPTPANNSTLYFPPNSGTWETVTPASLGWNDAAITDLTTYLSSTNTRAFIVLKNGKIVIEQYAGTQLTSGAFTASSNWYWASAGKTLTSAIVGIANGNGKINLDEKTSTYLGSGWSSLTPTQESKITVRNQLTMTTGLDDSGGPSGNNDCTLPSCLVYLADPGTRWAYHTGAYTLLDGVIASATGKDTNGYGTDQLFSKIGMDGSFQITNTYNNVFYSTPRSMARFGLLLLNQGAWNGTTIIPSSYFNLLISTSQNLNLSYGYLTWLNGKSSFMSPGSQAVYPRSLSLNAPADMFAAMGKNGQLINVVPSKNLVVIRMGDSPDNDPVPFTFQDNLWAKLNAVITN